MREWHELRVREKIGPAKWVKKSKFYFVHTPGDAVEKYTKRAKVDHTIMWCEKDKRHGPEYYSQQMTKLSADIRRETKQQQVAATKPQGNSILGFFGLGDSLLAELRSQEKNKVIKRRENDNRKKAAHETE
jgi:hypothetical protein